MRVQYPKLYKMTHFLALNVLLLPKDLTIIFICFQTRHDLKKKKGGSFTPFFPKKYGPFQLGIRCVKGPGKNALIFKTRI